MQYTTNEIDLALPTDAMQDLSVNVLVFKDLGTTLMIGRGYLQEDEHSLAESFSRQMVKLKRQVQAFKSTPQQEIMIGAKNDIAAIENSNQYIRGREHTYQYQLAYLLPNSRKMIAMNYVKQTPLGEIEEKHWQQIKASISFTE